MPITKVTSFLNDEIEDSSLMFDKYSSFLLAGRSGSGKTEFILELLRNHRKLGHDTSYTRIIICYREDQNGLYENLSHLFSEATHISLFQGTIPFDLCDSLDPNEEGDLTHHLIIIDDLFSEAFSSPVVQQLFISGRHKKATVMLTTQNLFPPGSKYARTISLNASYIILFRSRDVNQIKVLSRQLLGSSKDSFLETAFNDAIKNFGYLVIDCSPRQQVDEVRYRTDIFNEQPTVYLPKRTDHSVSLL